MTDATHLVMDGSSPRMRGTLPWISEAAQTRRFIPAHAGNTPTPSPAKRCPPVHPRACGEHSGWPRR
ncbi:protein of unknown function [Denitratisoma oestradiolicum]|uniref:Uncharacterized protein n=1 Tax=Denitratisoma oestradiolicum TaxID=311182 RepID=A0A6S6Y688_9PROT|nr:protein of unknown function [Denitratisoma oestradiolicum]